MHCTRLTRPALRWHFNTLSTTLMVRAGKVHENLMVDLSASNAKKRRQAEDLRHSVAGHVGRGIEPLIAPMGFDWKIGTALIGAFAAKEVFVAQMGIVYSLGEVSEESTSLRDALAAQYSPLVGFCLMIFLLIATPCMATIAITRRESGSWKWPLLQFFGLTTVAYVVAALVFQIGSLF